MQFAKLHGCGNDYIFLDCTRGEPEGLPALARRLSDRHFGVGADGLICLCPSDRADFRMKMYNADGSEGAMCGNGVRCLCKFAWDRGLTRKTSLTVETGAGLRRVELRGAGGAAASAAVDMGAAEVGRPMEVSVKGKSYTAVPAWVGNPHLVVLAAPEELDLAAIGPVLEHHPHFPDRANVEFVRAEGPGLLCARVWERGSGETLSCGTGACAAAAVFHASGQCAAAVEVRLPGGPLGVHIEEGTGRIWLTGPAVTVFEGETVGK